MAEYLTSELLRGAGFRHAFFTRNGGVSSDPYRSLNFSIAVGDDRALVDENFERAAQVLGVPAPRLYFLSQVHGSASVIADGGEPRAEFARREGDIVLGSIANLASAVRTADCVPILLADRKTGAVAAVHAGWRGVVRGAVEAGVEALRALAGARGDLLAAIGPHISREAFEVSEDVAAELERASPERDVVDRSRARPHVDLRRIVHAKLRAAGLANGAIDHVLGCTFLDEARFFSFRRDGSASGRHLSAIVPEPRLRAFDLNG